MPEFDTHASYDEVPYEGGIIEGTHIDSLAATARLFGLSSADVTDCRVLEIGCGTGGNIIPMAYSLPGSSFLGIDLSARQIEMAGEHAARLPINNLELVHADVRELTGWSRQFDYIVCHGVFSWVPEGVRTAILDVCSRLLAPDGVAYISYNANPGWRLTGAVRDMARFHARFFEDPQERITQTRALIQFLADATENIIPDTGRWAWSTWIAVQNSMIAERLDGYVMHEFLEGENVAFYLHEFLDLLPAHGLEYLGDVDLSTMLLANLPPEVGTTINEISPTQHLLEQYRDFVINRNFRQSVVCRTERELRRNIAGSLISTFLFRIAVKRASDGSWTMPQPVGRLVTAKEPTVLAVLDALEAASPRSLTFRALREAIPEGGWPEDKKDDGPRAEHLAAVLLSLLATSAVHFRTWDPPLEVATPERPRAYAPARAAPGTTKPTPFHEGYGFEPFVEFLVPLMDGTRDIEELARLALAAIKDGTLKVSGTTAQDEGIQAKLQGFASASVERLRVLGLLEPSVEPSA